MKSNGAVDGRADAVIAPGDGSEVKDRSRRRGTSEPLHRDDIGRADVAGGVHARAGNSERAAPTRHGELHAACQRSVEAVECRSRFVAHPCVRPKRQQAHSQPLVPRLGCGGEHDHGRGGADHPAAGDRRSLSSCRHSESTKLAVADRPMLSACRGEERCLVHRLPWASASRRAGSRSAFRWSNEARRGRDRATRTLSGGVLQSAMTVGVASWRRSMMWSTRP